MAKTQNKFTEDWLPVKKIENGMIIYYFNDSGEIVKITGWLQELKLNLKISLF